MKKASDLRPRGCLGLTTGITDRSTSQPGTDPMPTASQKVAPLKNLCSIFTQAKYISVKFFSDLLPVYVHTYLPILEASKSKPVAKLSIAVATVLVPPPPPIAYRLQTTY